jgi:hypothetical protein
MKRLLTLSLVLVLAVLACSLPGLPPIVTEPPIVTLPPVITAPPVVTEPPVIGAPMPNGFVGAPDLSSLVFYDPNGMLIGGLPTGDLGYIGSQSVHVAGGTSSGYPPVIYFTWRDGPAEIIQNLNGVESVLLNQPDFYRMGGAPGLEFTAYTTAVYSGSGLTTRLYIGTPGTLAAAAPVLDLLVDDGFGLKPLAVRMEAGAPSGVWYTGCLVGVGGDLVFDPCNRVSYVDLASGAITELVGDGYNPSTLSPDQNWVAYAQVGGGMPLIIQNLGTGATVTFPAWSGNDRGSGDAVFSPDGTLVAWMEGNGYIMEEPRTFNTIVRVGTTAGVLVTEIIADGFTASAGFTVVTAIPVGWLDNDSLLVQVGGLDWHDHAIIRLDLDGTLTWLTSGTFITLTYP